MAKVCTQIKAEVKNEVGKLAELTERLAEAGVNIVAAVAWVEANMGQIRMVTSDNDKGLNAIRSTVTSCTLEDVVCLTVKNEVGALNRIAGALGGAGIGIQRLYASAAKDEAMVVIQTTDNGRAVAMI